MNATQLKQLGELKREVEKLQLRWKEFGEKRARTTGQKASAAAVSADVAWEPGPDGFRKRSTADLDGQRKHIETELVQLNREQAVPSSWSGGFPVEKRLRQEKLGEELLKITAMQQGDRAVGHGISADGHAVAKGRETTYELELRLLQERKKEVETRLRELNNKPALSGMEYREQQELGVELLSLGSQIRQVETWISGPTVPRTEDRRGK